LGAGSFVVAGLAGAGLVGITSLLLHATAAEFALATIGVVLFVGLSALDRQRIEEIYRTRRRDNSAHGLAVLGALALYVDASVFPLLLQFKTRA
jgi:FtsH-binding integral membrane protein